jgi:hypothetical protein
MYTKAWEMESMTLPKLQFKMSIYLKNNIVDKLGKYSKLLIPWFHIWEKYKDIVLTI